MDAEFESEFKASPRYLFYVNLLAGFSPVPKDRYVDGPTFNRLLKISINLAKGMATFDHDRKTIYGCLQRSKEFSMIMLDHNRDLLSMLEDRLGIEDNSGDRIGNIMVAIKRLNSYSLGELNDPSTESDPYE